MFKNIYLIILLMVIQSSGSILAQNLNEVSVESSCKRWCGCKNCINSINPDRYKKQMDVLEKELNPYDLSLSTAGSKLWRGAVLHEQACQTIAQALRFNAAGIASKYNTVPPKNYELLLDNKIGCTSDVLLKLAAPRLLAEGEKETHWGMLRYTRSYCSVKYHGKLKDEGDSKTTKTADSEIWVAVTQCFSTQDATTEALTRLLGVPQPLPLDLCRLYKIHNGPGEMCLVCVIEKPALRLNDNFVAFVRGPFSVCLYSDSSCMDFAFKLDDKLIEILEQATRENADRK